MTATGSHEYFYSLRGAQPPGEGIFSPRRGLAYISNKKTIGMPDSRRTDGFFILLTYSRSKSSAPCLHRGQMKSGGSSSPSYT